LQAIYYAAISSMLGLRFESDDDSALCAVAHRLLCVDLLLDLVLEPDAVEVGDFEDLSPLDAVSILMQLWFSLVFADPNGACYALAHAEDVEPLLVRLHPLRLTHVDHQRQAVLVDRLNKK